ncbi:MAG: hypothetical protein KY451_06895 [Actinobacteria bacterium]|nr:hypothetical protein [Actinomycetota bacterium]
MDIEVVRWSELVSRAGSIARARTWLATGRWWQVFHDAYTPAWVEPGPQVRVAALRVVLPPDAAFSHRAALWLLGIDVLGDLVDVTGQRGRHLEARPGVGVHSAALPDDELCDVGGLLVVSAARAVVDVARREPLVEAVAVADAVLRAGAATQQQILASLEAAGGLRGVCRAREILPHLEPRSESLMESRFRMRLVLGGVPRPEAQWDAYDEDGHIGRADLHLRGVVLEYDGREARLDKKVFVAERRRQTRIAETGCEIRRFTSADCYVRPAAAVCAEVLRAVAQAEGRDRSRLRSGPDTLRKPRLTPLPTRSETARETAA